MMQVAPPQPGRGAQGSKWLTPAGGMLLALGMSAVLWSAVVESVHLLGIF